MAIFSHSQIHYSFSIIINTFCWHILGILAFDSWRRDKKIGNGSKCQRHCVSHLNQLPKRWNVCILTMKGANNPFKFEACSLCFAFIFGRSYCFCFLYFFFEKIHFDIFQRLLFLFFSYVNSRQSKSIWIEIKIKIKKQERWFRIIGVFPPTTTTFSKLKNQFAWKLIARALQMCLRTTQNSIYKSGI